LATLSAPCSAVCSGEAFAASVIAYSAAPLFISWTNCAWKAAACALNAW